MPVAASAIYFLNLRGDVLINRLYRDDVGYVCVSLSIQFFFFVGVCVLIRRVKWRVLHGQSKRWGWKDWWVVEP